MKKTTTTFICSMIVLSLSISSCKKDDNIGKSDKIQLEQLGNIKADEYSNFSYNFVGNPIIGHSTGFFYEWDDAQWNKLGSAATLFNPTVVQDAMGNYFFTNSSSNQLQTLDKTTNTWVSAGLPSGSQPKLVANTNGDIVYRLAVTSITPKKWQWYKKAGNSTTWIKFLEANFTGGTGSSDGDINLIPVYLSNSGIVYMQKSGGILNKVLNTSTGVFSNLWDQTDLDNFPVLECGNYDHITPQQINPDGTIYVTTRCLSDAKINLYKLEPNNSKFVKVQEFERPQLNGTTSGADMHIDQNGKIRFKSAVNTGAGYSIHGLGLGTLNSSKLNIIEDDTQMWNMIKSPKGKVYLYNPNSDGDKYVYWWK